MHAALRLGCLCTALVMTVGGVGVAAHAQTVEIKRPAYLMLWLGPSGYGGERGGVAVSRSGEFRQGRGAAFGIEAGYDWSPLGTLGLFYGAARYPHILTPKGLPPWFASISREQSSHWIHTLGAVGRIRFMPDRRFTPFVHIGVAGTFGWINDALRAGLGPLGGGGLEIAVAPNLYVFMGIDRRAVFPGRAIDLAGATGDTDVISSANVGITYRLDGYPAPPPVIDRVSAPGRLYAGEPGIFSGSVVVDDFSERVDYRWDFGDGLTAEGREVEHAYESPGAYTVRLTASIGSAASERTHSIVVEAEPALVDSLNAAASDGGPITGMDRVAIKLARVFPQTPREDQPVQFSMRPAGRGVVKCRWDFGDGSVSEACNPAHTYGEPGAYTVVLTVTGVGGRDTHVQEITVVEDPCADLPALDPVYFEPDVSALDVQGRAFLRRNVLILMACPEVNVVISGHALADEADPVQLSQERADAVARYYRNLGIPADRLTTVGLGVWSEVPEGSAVWQYRRVLSVPFRP